MERAFSLFGMVHTKLGNRLKNDRVMKLVRVYCYLWDKDGDDGDDLEAVKNVHKDLLVSSQ